MGTRWINRSAIFQKTTEDPAKSGAPEGSVHVQPVATLWKNCPAEKPLQGHPKLSGTFRSAASSSGAPWRVSGFLTDQTNGVAMGCEKSSASGQKHSGLP